MKEAKLQRRKRIVVVLGMHRSGTSALARGLVPLGVELGDRLMPAVPGNNERGFWEDLDVHELNAQLLRSLGREWDTLTPLDPAELKRHDLHPFRVAATDLLRGKLADKSIYGLKDPQLCLLLPFWKPLFASIDSDVDYVISTRHPLSVAESLKKRDAMELEKGLYLWLNHAASAVNDSVGARRVVVSYDLLMREPEAQLRRIAEGLSLTFDSASSEFRDFAEGFLSKDLRHSEFKTADLKAVPGIADDVVKTHELLEKLARDAAVIDSKPVSDFFQAVTQRLIAMRPALAYMSRRDSELRQLKHNEQIHALQLAVSGRDGQIHALNIAAGDREERIAGLARTLAERDAQVQEYRQTVDGLNAKIHALALAVESRDGQIHGLNLLVGERDRRIAELAHAKAELDALKLALDSREAVLKVLQDAMVKALRAESEFFRESASRSATAAAGASQAAAPALLALEHASQDYSSAMFAMAEELGGEPFATSDASRLSERIESAAAARRHSWERALRAAADLALVLQQSERETEINRLRLVDGLREAARRQDEITALSASIRDLEGAVAQRELQLRERESQIRERDRLLGQFGHQFVSRVGAILDPYPSVRWVITAPLRLIHWLIGQARA